MNNKFSCNGNFILHKKGLNQLCKTIMGLDLLFME